MAIAWVLRDPRVTSALIGACSVEQLEDSLGALDNLDFSDDELAEIDRHAVDAGINLWAASSEKRARRGRRVRAHPFVYVELHADPASPSSTASSPSDELAARRSSGYDAFAPDRR